MNEKFPYKWICPACNEEIAADNHELIADFVDQGSCDHCFRTKERLKND